MGLIAQAADARNPGGRRHTLPAVLAQLKPEDAADLREVLSRPHDAVDWSQVHRALLELGVEVSLSGVRNWSHDYKRDPGRFDAPA